MNNNTKCLLGVLTVSLFCILYLVFFIGSMKDAVFYDLPVEEAPTFELAGRLWLFLWPSFIFYICSLIFFFGKGTRLKAIAFPMIIITLYVFKYYLGFSIFGFDWTWTFVVLFIPFLSVLIASIFIGIFLDMEQLKANVQASSKEK